MSMVRFHKNVSLLVGNFLQASILPSFRHINTGERVQITWHFDDVHNFSTRQQQQWTYLNNSQYSVPAQSLEAIYYVSNWQ